MSILSFMILTFSLALLLLPALMLAALFRAGNRPAAVFITGSMLLFQLLFWAAAAGLDLNSGALLLILAVFNLIIGSAAGFSGFAWKNLLPREKLNFLREFRNDWTLWFFAAACLLILLRGIFQPLSGWDTPFRWNFLALKILETGSLQFYPPLTAADFSEYFYTDAIPPLVSFSYFWLYTFFGKAATWLPGIHVLLQYSVLGSLVRALARELGGSKAAAAATLLLTASPLLFWSVFMAQETGLTAIALTGTMYFIISARDADDSSAMILAGAAAALGWLAREYGGIFLICGLTACRWRSLSRRSCIVFTVTFFTLGFPWYARNWLLTGNPFYSHDLLGLFPVNRIHNAMLKAYSGMFGFGSEPVKAVLTLLRVLFFTMPLQIIFGIPGGIISFRRHGYLMISILLVTGLWLYTVPQTAGGMLYAARVLSPGLALLSVLGGTWIAGIESSKRRQILIRTCALLAVPALAASALMPRNLWNLPPSEWLRAGFKPAPQTFAESATSMASELTADTRILSDNAYFHAAMHEYSVQAVPVWSPEVRFLFSPDTSSAQALEQLHALNIKAFLYWPASMNNNYLRNFPFFRDLQTNARNIIEIENCLLVFF